MANRSLSVNASLKNLTRHPAQYMWLQGSCTGELGIYDSLQTTQITVLGCTSGEVPISAIPSWCFTSRSGRLELLSMVCDSWMTVDLESEGREQSL